MVNFPKAQSDEQQNFIWHLHNNWHYQYKLTHWSLCFPSLPPKQAFLEFHHAIQGISHDGTLTMPAWDASGGHNQFWWALVFVPVLTSLLPLKSLDFILKSCTRKRSFQSSPDNSDWVNWDWHMHKNAQKLQWKTWSKMRCPQNQDWTGPDRTGSHTRSRTRSWIGSQIRSH